MRQLFKRPELPLPECAQAHDGRSASSSSAAGLYIFFSADNATKYGLDFTGGAAVRVVLNERMEQKDMVSLLQDDEAFKKSFGEAQVTTLGEAEPRVPDQDQAR